MSVNIGLYCLYQLISVQFRSGRNKQNRIFYINSLRSDIPLKSYRKVSCYIYRLLFIFSYIVHSTLYIVMRFHNDTLHVPPQVMQSFKHVGGLQFCFGLSLQYMDLCLIAVVTCLCLVQQVLGCQEIEVMMYWWDYLIMYIWFNKMGYRM